MCAEQIHIMAAPGYGPRWAVCLFVYIYYVVCLPIDCKISYGLWFACIYDDFFCLPVCLSVSDYHLYFLGL